MKICITGGAGFVGCSLALYLKEKGFEVVVFDNLVRRGSETNLDEFKRKGIKFIHGDVRCQEDIVNIPKDTNIICECSAQPSATEGYGNPYFDITNNSIGVINVLEYARKIGAGVIMWSTNKVYSGEKINAIPFVEKAERYEWKLKECRDMSLEEVKNTLKNLGGFSFAEGVSQDFSVDGGEHSIYGLSKIQADLACQEWFNAFGVKTVINRWSCLAGEKQWGVSAQGWFAFFCIAFHFNLPLEFIGFKGKQVRDVLFIEDICKLVELEINNIDRIGGEVFTVGGGMGINTSLIEQYNRLVRIYDKTVPLSIVETPRKADHRIYISDISKVKRVLGWEPKVDLEEGTKRIKKWVEDNEEVLRKLYL